MGWWVSACWWVGRGAGGWNWYLSVREAGQIFIPYEVLAAKSTDAYLFHKQFFCGTAKRLVQAIVPSLVPNVLLQEYKLSH